MDGWCYLGDEQNHQGDVDGEDDGQRGEGEGGVLLGGQNHGDRSRDETQHLSRDTNQASVFTGQQAADRTNNRRPQETVHSKIYLKD